MTRTTLRTASALLLAATIGTTVAGAPASAGGSITFNYTPANAKDAKALKTGLLIYGIANAVKGGASIKQIGKNNAAGIGQFGSGNFGVVHQEGKGHSGTLSQYGNNNAYGVFQFGKNTSSDVVQAGNGDVGATFQFGW